MMKTAKKLISTLLLLSVAACGVEGDEQIGASSSEISGRPYLELFKSSENGDYYFNVIAANHEIILSSQGYGSRTSALAGILSVRKNAADAANFQIKEARNGDYYFNLRAGNNKVIGTSEMYASESSAQRGVEAVMNACEDYEAFLAERTGARFDIFQGNNGKHYFNLHAANGEIVLSSQGYSTEASAWNGAFAVSYAGLNADNYDIKQASNGGYYFNLIASNGQVIGTSEVYSSKSNAKRATDGIIELLPSVDMF